jgi:cytochrome P450
LFDRELVPLKDQGGSQSMFNHALLGNMIPTAFWVLWDIISRPRLVENIREEIEANALYTLEGDSMGNAIELDVTALKTQCPLLLSSYQETQRTRSIHANIRQVIAETLIKSPITENHYYLAKGQYLQMPSGPIHKDPKIWGATASHFDPYRFMNDNGCLPQPKIADTYTYLPWGSAPHLCPARQFASTEIMLFVALMVMRFEVSPPFGEQSWETLDSKVGELVSVMPPQQEVLVDIARRDGWSGGYVLKMGSSSNRVPLASG